MSNLKVMDSRKITKKWIYIYIFVVDLKLFFFLFDNCIIVTFSFGIIQNFVLITGIQPQTTETGLKRIIFLF